MLTKEICRGCTCLFETKDKSYLCEECNAPISSLSKCPICDDELDGLTEWVSDSLGNDFTIIVI